MLLHKTVVEDECTSSLSSNNCEEFFLKVDKYNDDYDASVIPPSVIFSEGDTVLS